MRLSDIFIRGRERVLDRLSGVHPSLVLNHDPVQDQEALPSDLAARLNEVLRNLKAKAMDASGARIDYAAVRRSRAYSNYRERYLSQLSAFNPQSLPALNERRAFWINLYNALVIDAVITFDVDDSVTEGLLGALSFFRRAAYNVSGKRVSLDDIEHGILRSNCGHPLLPGRHFPSSDPRLKWVLPLDPRIHFALNCGARSCPPIRSYMPEKLDAQLDLAARGFVNNDVEIEGTEICLSQLFRWYRADFGGREGVRRVLDDYLDDDKRHALRMKRQSPLRWRYKPYDWGLNALHAA
ncbi:MAG: DUF547 domain-containing protein [Chloroflexota bacterium]